MKTNVMLDLECLGVSAGCKLLSIGAVVFGPQGTHQTPRFDAAVLRHLQPPALVENPDTVNWWAGQSEAARARVFGADNGAKPLHVVLADFTGWLYSIDKKALVWGNGADFDLPILGAAYHACGMAQPWGNWSGRCYRTLKGLRPMVPFVRSGVHHDALHDAISQADHAAQILNLLGAWE